MTSGKEWLAGIREIVKELDLLPEEEVDACPGDLADVHTQLEDLLVGIREDMREPDPVRPMRQKKRKD